MLTRAWLRWLGLALLVGGVVILGFSSYPYISSALTVIPTAPALTLEPATEQRPTISPTSGVTVTPTATQVDATATPGLLDTNKAATSTPTATPSAPFMGEVPAQIRIIDIDLDAPVLTIGWEYVISDGQRVPVWDVPDQFAAGWHKTSALLGSTGNTVINGHNTNNGEVFRDLYKLDTGALIEVAGAFGDIYIYQVTEKFILPEAGQPLAVRLKNAEYIQETPDERLTLVTCHPYGSLRNRLIIIAKPMGDIDRLATPDIQKGE